MELSAENIKSILKNVIDPEVELNIVDLGLIYEIQLEDNIINVTMTLSTPACPIGDVIVQNVQESILNEFSQSEVNVDLVFDPPWSADMISEEGKLKLSQ